MAKKKGTNILIRGADGRLYGISADDLEQYAIPDEQAQEITEKLNLEDHALSVFEAGDEDNKTTAGFTTAGFTGGGFTKGGFTRAGFTRGRRMLFANFGFTGRKKGGS